MSRLATTQARLATTQARLAPAPRTGPTSRTPDGLLVGLIAYWKLDEASGKAYDATEYHHNATAVNAPVSGTGQIGAGRQFVRASNQSLNVSGDTGLQIPAGSGFTITAWVKFDTIATTGGYEDVILSKFFVNQSLREYDLEYGSSTHGLRLIVSANGTTTTTVTNTAIGDPSVGTWYFVAAWYDRSTINIQINNGATSSSAFTSDIFQSSVPLILGGFVNNFAMHSGMLDEIGLWNRALTPNEIRYLYNSGTGRTYPFTGL